MTNEANIFYKPLRRVSFCENTQPKKEVNTNWEITDMHVITLNTDDPVKLSKSPRLKVNHNHVINKYNYAILYDESI